jgi:hypothetical protein
MSTLRSPTYWRWRNSVLDKVNEACVGNARLIPNRLLVTAQALDYDVITGLPVTYA